MGKGRGRAELAEVAVGWRGPKGYQPVMSEDGLVTTPAALVPETPPMPPAVEVMLATPLRLLADGRLVSPRHFRPGLLLEQAVRRVSLLQRLYGEAPAKADFDALFALARTAHMAQADLWLADQYRWSASQEEEIDMDGIVGTFVLPLDGLEPLWGWLWAAQWFHAGKGAAMGLGAVRLRGV